MGTRTKKSVFCTFLVTLLSVPSLAQETATSNQNSNDKFIIDNSVGLSPISLEAMQERIYELESQHDAFHPAIGEVAYDIANEQRNRGFYEDALKNFRRYLHVLRINEGLETEKQIPVLQDIVDTHYRHSDPEKAGNVLRALFEMYERYPKVGLYGIPEFISAGEWHLQSRQYSQEIHEEMHLSLAYHNFRRVAEIKSIEENVYDPEIFKIMSAIAYRIAENAKIDNDLLGTTKGLNAYNKGIEALRYGLFTAQQSAEPGNTVEAFMQLGDWSRRFKKYRLATSYYLEAYNLTQGLPEEHQLKYIFDEPQEIPDLSFIDKIGVKENKLEEETQLVTISFNVSRWGKASNSQVIKQPIFDDNSKTKRLKRAAVRKNNRRIYRPQIENSEVVEAKNIERTISVTID